MNISKTNYVIFHSQSKRSNEFIRIKLGSKPLNRAEYIQYLGILVDSTLSWKPQITELSKKLARTTGMFFKKRHYVTSDTLKLLYYSLFYSFISYGIVVWGLTHPTILDCLFRLQKRVVRAISFKDIYAHSNPLFYKLKLLKLFDIHTLNLLSLVYECQNNQSIQPFDDYFTPLYSVHNYNTRQAFKGDIYVPDTNTTQYGKRSARYTGSILWNSLDLFIRQSPSSFVFKKGSMTFTYHLILSKLYHSHVTQSQLIVIKFFILLLMFCMLPNQPTVTLSMPILLSPLSF